MSKPDGLPFIGAGLPIRVFWFEQKYRHNQYLAHRSADNLERVFSLFGKQENCATLRVDQEEALPFAGEWFSKIELGRNIRIRSEAVLSGTGGVTLGDGVVIGQRAALISGGHPIHPGQRHLNVAGQICIGRNVLIGADAIVINAGKVIATSIGEGSIVLPNAIITKDVPPYSLMGGTNQVLLQGEQYFHSTDSVTDNSYFGVADRLSREGMLRLAGVEWCDHLHHAGDLSVSSVSLAHVGARIYRELDANDIANRNSFFKETPPSELETCVIPSPVYVTGDTPRLKSGMIVNWGCLFCTFQGGSIQFSEGNLLAPMASLTTQENATIRLGPKAWCGVRSEILASRGQNVTIGNGSILAAGAKVDNDVPPMSIVTGDKGEVARTISDKDILPVPDADWNNVRAYREYQSRNVTIARGMNPAQRQEYIDVALGR